MQRTWVMGFGVMCLNLAAISSGLESPGTQGMIRSVVEAAKAVRLDPVVVTGTQVALPMSELPSAVTVIEREDIDSRQIADVLQLLRTVPGLSVSQTGGRGGDTAVRARGGERDFNLGLIDGVPVNNAGGEYNFSDLTTDNIERIEIIRGPQSALYGSNAIGSVIQIFTRRGHGPFQGDVAISAAAASTPSRATA